MPLGRGLGVRFPHAGTRRPRQRMPPVYCHVSRLAGGRGGRRQAAAGQIRRRHCRNKWIKSVWRAQACDSAEANSATHNSAMSQDCSPAQDFDNTLYWFKPRLLRVAEASYYRLSAGGHLRLRRPIPCSIDGSGCKAEASDKKHGRCPPMPDTLLCRGAEHTQPTAEPTNTQSAKSDRLRGRRSSRPHNFTRTGMDELQSTSRKSCTTSKLQLEP